MQCSACGASYDPSEIFCSFCDSDLKKQRTSKDNLIRDLEAKILSEDDKSVYKAIRNFSRQVRRNRFKFSELERLVDINEDLPSSSSEALRIRFAELIDLVRTEYIEKNSIVLFGEVKELFEDFS